MEQVQDSLRKMNLGVKQAFSAVKEEMTQHLETINQNTNEVQACYEYLAELDAKLEKLSERLDRMELATADDLPVAQNICLTHREQEVFMILYTAEDPVTALDVARRLGLTVEMVDSYLSNISAKGVPILRSFLSGKVYHSLDLKFKQLQAKKNVLKISESLSHQLLEDKAI